MSSDSENCCEGCDIELTEDVHIFNLEQKDTEASMTLCSTCWDDHKKELEDEGWFDADEEKPVQILTACFTSYSQWKLPRGLILKESEEGSKWWIKWGTLHYLDANGEEHALEPDTEGECNKKRPDSVVIESE